MSKKLTEQEKARRLWVRALRSGKYGWGKQELHPKEGKFCCLGVLCEVAKKHGIIYTYDPRNGMLDNYRKVMEWVGLSDGEGRFNAGVLASINDESKRNPFAKIATLIEKKPKGLFVNEEQA
jgi:hypothetical protein